MNGVILAGGKGTRLGPLAAQISKALVSIGQRPQVINQIEQLRKAGCWSVVVVTSPDTDKQVCGVIERAGVHFARTVVQPEPLGPVDALRVGLAAVDAIELPTLVLMSDTVVTESFNNLTTTWVGVAKKPAGDRSWCYLDLKTGRYVDGVPPGDEPVTIGIYYFAESLETYKDACGVLREKVGYEAGMSQLLNVTYPARQLFTTWQDVGDVMALAHARRERFIARAHHQLTLHADGTLTKSGASRTEANFMLGVTRAPRGHKALFPQVHDIDLLTGSYTMDFVDLPSLAELWLYWPGRADTWVDILRGVIDRCWTDLWPDVFHEGYTGRTYEFFCTKVFERIRAWDPQRLTPSVIEQIECAGTIVSQDKRWVAGHGDLNFTNILYSLNSGAFKLLDPRGGPIPLSYEFTKLAYSVYFAPVVHDLFDAGHLWPTRNEERKAILDLIHEYVDPTVLKAAMALTLLAAPPLHKPTQAEMFWRIGTSLLNEVQS